MAGAGAWRISPNRCSGVIGERHRGCWRASPPLTPWLRGSDSTLGQGASIRHRHCRSMVRTEQGLAKRRVPWPITFSMSRMESRMYATTTAPNSTISTRPCKRRPALRLRLEPTSWRKGIAAMSSSWCGTSGTSGSAR